MDLHLHRKIIAIITALFMLVCVQAPAAFALDEGGEQAEETKAPQQTEEQTEPETQGQEQTEPEKTPEENKDAEKPDNQEAKTIDVTFSILIDQEDSVMKWLPESKVTIRERATAEDLLKDVLKAIEFKCEISDQGELISITSSPEAGNYCLKKGDLGENTGWTYEVNEKKAEKPMRDFDLSDKDKVVVRYTKIDESEAAAEETEAAEEDLTAEEEVTDPEEEAKTLSQLAAGTSEKEIGDAYGNTKDKLTDLADSVNWNSESTWIVLAMARGGDLGQEQAQAYFNSVAEAAESGNAIINTNQSSDNSKAILALTAAGYDPTDVNGYNLLEPLANIAYVRAQGVNGPIWALLAFDSNGYEIPTLDMGNPDTSARFQTTRENLVATLLTSQKSDDGWAYSGTKSDVDMTCMALQALAPYYKTDMKVMVNGREVSVRDAVDKALAWLSKIQNKDGSFSSGGVVTSESASQVIVALTSLGIDPAKDARFLKNGKGALDSLMSFYTTGGGFKHIDSNYKWNPLATSQAFYALVSYYRGLDGKNSLYDMTDAGDGYKIDPSYEHQEEEEGSDGPDEEQPAKPEGKAKGLSKSGGLIKLKGDLTKNAAASVSLIQKVVERKLPKDARKYSAADIKAINDAYKAYMKLSPAEKLAIKKNKFWKPFSRITAKVGKVYHFDRESGIDMRDNNEGTLPWYIKLVIEDEQLEQEKTDKIEGLLGEEGKLFAMYDVYFKNTLTGKKWHPERIIEMKMPIPEELTGDAVAVHITDKDKIEFINGEAADGSLKIKAADFSPYGIAGMHGSLSQLMTPQEEQESILPWILVGIAAIAALLLIFIIRRKKTDEE